MDCKEVKEMLGALIDNEVTPAEREALLSHIAECENCKNEYNELQNLRKEFTALNSQLHVAIAEQVMGKVIEEAHPKKKTPFIIRHIGTAAAIVIILTTALIVKLQPDILSKSEEALSADNSILSQAESATADKTNDKKYQFSILTDSVQHEEAVESDTDDGTEEVKTTKPLAAPPEAPMESVNSSPMAPETPMPESTLDAEPETAMPEAPAEPEMPSDPYLVRLDNQIPISTSIIVIDGDAKDVLPYLDEIEAVGTNYVNVSTHYEDVMEILTQNSFSPIYMDVVEDPSTNTSVYSSDILN